MSVFLLLVGLSLFISGAAMYLAHAARNDPRWVASSLLFPFVVPLYYRRNWDELQVAGLVQAGGLAMAVAGGLMLAFQGDHPAGLVAQQGGAFAAASRDTDSGFVDSERALKMLVRHGPGTPLGGRVNGKPFKPDRVEFIADTLRLIEGRPFWPDREIAIRFPAGSIDPTRGAKRAIAPDAAGVPVLQLSWLDENGQQVSEVFRGGYRLEFDLVPVSGNKLAGYIQLMVPDRFESYVGGDVTVLTSHLRYVDGEVDRHFGHEDTLAFVAEEYLRTQYAGPDIARIAFERLEMDSLADAGEGLATVTLKDGRQGRHVVKFGRGVGGWVVLGPESQAATTAAGFQPVYGLVIPGEAERTVAPARVPAPAAAPVRKASERTVEFAELATLGGQGAVVEYRNGRSEKGVLRGLRKDRLVVEANKAGGVVEYLVSEQELARLRLNSGEIIRLAGSEASTPAVAAPAAPAAAAPAEPLMVGDRDLSSFLNRSVKVTASSGKVTTGVFRGLNKNGLVVETMVGSGKLDYIVPVDQFAGIEFAR